VLDFDFYGRIVGLRVTSSANSTLSPSLIDAAGAERESARRDRPRRVPQSL